MKLFIFVISGSYSLELVKTFTFASKLSDYVVLEFWPDQLNISVMTPLLNGFAMISFPRTMFDTYKVQTPQVPQCLRLEYKSITSFSMEWEQDSLGVSIKTPDFVKTARFPVEVVSAFHAKFPDLQSHVLKWVIPPQTMKLWIKSFMMQDEDVIWNYENHKFILKSSEEDAKMTIRSEVEVHDLQLPTDSLTLMFSVVEVKAFLALAESLNASTISCAMHSSKYTHHFI